MHRTPITLALLAGAVLVLAGGVTLVAGSAPDTGLSPAGAAALHGTPNPSATPHVHADDALKDDPTYYADIEPILQTHCLACHQTGGIGHATFPMDDLNVVTNPAQAQRLAFVTGIGYMPPWPPGDESLPMAHERKLSDAEIALLTRWAERGAPLGDVADRPPAAASSDVPEIRADVVLTMPDPYTPTGNMLDDYRCFVLDPGFTDDTLITGTDFKPGNTAIAHHALFFIIDEDMAAEAAAKSAADGRPGWECFGGTGLQRAARPRLGAIDQQALIAALMAQDADIPAILVAFQDYQAANAGQSPDPIALVDLLRAQGVDVRRLIIDLDIDIAAMSGSGMDGSVGGWVPGAVPVTSPPNTGILVPAGSQIVLQMHYNLYTTLGSDQSTLILETAPYSEAMTPLRAQALVAPVEIPCPDGVEASACDRERARRETINPNTPNALLAACGQTLDTYAANTADHAYGYCDYPIDFEGWLLGVGPHMHELGKSSRVVLNPATTGETVLIDIPAWDFHWQGQYSFAQPVPLQPGDIVRLECWWDNSSGDRYVTWGEGTQDEMCFNFTRFLVRQDGKTLADYGYE